MEGVELMDWVKWIAGATSAVLERVSGSKVLAISMSDLGACFRMLAGWAQELGVKNVRGTRRRRVIGEPRTSAQIP